MFMADTDAILQDFMKRSHEENGIQKRLSMTEVDAILEDLINSGKELDPRSMMRRSDYHYNINGEDSEKEEEGKWDLLPASINNLFHTLGLGKSNFGEGNSHHVKWIQNCSEIQNEVF